MVAVVDFHFDISCRRHNLNDALIVSNANVTIMKNNMHRLAFRMLSLTEVPCKYINP